MHDKDANQNAMLHSLVQAMKVQIYMLITQTGANNRGTDKSTHLQSEIYSVNTALKRIKITPEKSVDIDFYMFKGS